MNGRQAKKLRMLAGVAKENCQSRSYAGTNVKQKEICDGIHLDGNPIVVARYQTATYVLNQSARKVYKQMKQAFKRKQGIFASLRTV